jgi:Domain of unknown function (DUF4129)
MLKFIYSLLILNILLSPQYAFPQTNSDSLQTNADSSVLEVSGVDSLLLPVADSILTIVPHIREVPRNQFNKYLRDADYAYANDPEYWKRQQTPTRSQGNRFLDNPVFRWVIFLGIIIVVLFGIYQLARESNFTWFSRNGKKNDPLTLSTNLPEETDYEAAVRKYQAEGNYRMAVRYLYLRLIHHLRRKDGIRFDKSSTNAEIVFILGNHPWAAEFRYLASAYEYIYYGDLTLQPDLFEMLRDKFENFQNKIII